MQSRTGVDSHPVLNMRTGQPSPQPSVTQPPGGLSGWAVTDPQPWLGSSWLLLLPWGSPGPARQLQAKPGTVSHKGPIAGLCSFAVKAAAPGQGAFVQHSNVISSRSVQPSFLGPASHSCRREQQYGSLLCLVSLLGQDVSVAGIAWI